MTRPPPTPNEEAAHRAVKAAVEGHDDSLARRLYEAATLAETRIPWHRLPFAAQRQWRERAKEGD